MNFEKLRNYNTVILSLILTTCLIALVVLLLTSNWTGRRGSRSASMNNIENEIFPPEPAKKYPSDPMILNADNGLCLLPQTSVKQEMEVNEDSLTLFSVKEDGSEYDPILGYLAKEKSLLTKLSLLDSKTTKTINILPAGMHGHSVSFVHDMPDNWLCFLARPEKGHPQDELFVYSTANGRMHRIGKPGYCPVALHLWKNQSLWIISMGKDLNDDGFICTGKEPEEWMQYNSETQQLLPVE